jgi:hypothetical protein
MPKLHSCYYVSLSFCRAVFVMRSCPPSQVQRQLAWMDSRVRQCFERIVGLITEEVVWAQTSLPIRDHLPGAQCEVNLA